jgi:hypothetical protein
MVYPTVSEVVKADREQIRRWWMSLPRPQSQVEERALELILKKFICLGASSSEIVNRLKKH